MSSLDSEYYSKLVKLHKDFAQRLQVLLHTGLQTLYKPDDTVSVDTFEFLGKTIVQPHRDLFEKAKGLSVSHSTSSSFLTRAESESAMATARQHDLIGTHIDAVRSNTFGGRGRGNGKNSRRGAKRGAVSFGSSNRFDPWLLCRPLRRALRHRSSSSSSVNDDDNKNSSRPVGRLHPRRPRVASRVPLSPVVVVVKRGKGK